MKKTLFLLLILFGFIPFGIAQSRKKEKVYAIFPVQESGNYMDKGKVTPATLTKKDIRTIEKLMQHAVKDHNTKAKKEYQLNLSDYKRQYMPYTNSKGEKEVWINCLCHPKGDWRTTLVAVDDGGKCYFNLYINITQGKYYALMVNGNA